MLKCVRGLADPLPRNVLGDFMIESPHRCFCSKMDACMCNPFYVRSRNSWLWMGACESAMQLMLGRVEMLLRDGLTPCPEICRVILC